MDDDADNPPDPIFGSQLDDGWDAIARGDLGAAMDAAEACLELDEESPEAHNLMAYVLASAGQLEQSLEHYRAAVELDDVFFEAMMNAAEVLMQLGDLDAAVELAGTAANVADSDDDTADAVLLQVEALLSADRREEAEKILETVPHGPFSSAHVEFLLGRARFAVGDVEGAAPYIEQAAHQELNDPDVFYFLGLVRQAQGDLRGATVAFLQCRDLDLAAPRPSWSEPIPLFEKRIRDAIRRLGAPLQGYLEGALILVDEVPGAEAVSEGLDPRLPVLVDDVDLGSQGKLRRAFVYQRNVERLAASPMQLDEELRRSLHDEVDGAMSELPPQPRSEH